MTKILLVDDDVSLNDSINRYLTGCDYEVVSVYDADSAFVEIANRDFDAIISDIMMPNIDGFEFAERVRKTNKRIPILFLTARDDLSSKERGFGIGIDDYLVKPFDLSELNMRIGAILRRVQIEMSAQVKMGNLVMDKAEHAAYIDGEPLSLSAREFDLLFKLLSFPKRTFSRSQLMEEFWGYDSSGSSRAIDVFIAELRKKISGCDGFDVITVHGLGYKVVPK